MPENLINIMSENLTMFKVTVVGGKISTINTLNLG